MIIVLQAFGLSHQKYYLLDKHIIIELKIVHITLVVKEKKVITL